MFYSLELASMTVASDKLQLAVPGIKIVGYYCDADGRHPLTSRVIAILEWPVPTNLYEVRAFVGVCVYYRVWIAWFSVIAKPLYFLMKKGEKFVWKQDQQKAMDKLKLSLTSAPALMAIDYTEGAGTILVAADGSGEGWGGNLMQMARDLKKQHAV